MKTYSDILGGPNSQSEVLPGREDEMVQNAAGGFSFKADEWTRLDRFLILGSESNSYYASAKELTKENLKAVKACVAADGLRVVARIVEISKAGRAPKNDSAILALAYAAKKGDDATRRAALSAVSDVCRIGTHIFQFAEAVQLFGGWGRGTRRAVANWYTEKSADELAYQLVKYRQRDGWTHRDLLRLTHPAVNPVLGWAAGKNKGTGVTPDSSGEELELAMNFNIERIKNLPAIINGYEKIQGTVPDNAEFAASVVRDYNLPREAVPTELLNSKEVWDALLEKMPMTAMIRNLATMTRVGVIAPLSEGTGRVVDELASAERIKKAKVHPIAVLLALKTYASGQGFRGTNTWTPVPAVIDALNEAFYLAFGNVEPTGKRTFIGLDVSASMGMQIQDSNLSCSEAAAAMCMITARLEPKYHIFGFSNTFVELNISPTQRLDDIVRQTRGMTFGGTDCALPIKYALENKIPVDAFLTYSDGESWAGDVHVSKLLETYRQTMGIPARLVCADFTPTSYQLGDPKDAGTLHTVGLDSATPQIISDFVRGDL